MNLVKILFLQLGEILKHINKCHINMFFSKIRIYWRLILVEYWFATIRKYCFTVMSNHCFIKLVRCAKCFSNSACQYWSNVSTVLRQYRCNCGQYFCASMPFNQTNEKLIICFKSRISQDKSSYKQWLVFPWPHP